MLVHFNVPVTDVRVANSAVADVAVTSTRQILVSGKSFGTTQLVVWVAGGTQTMFDVAVDVDLERLQASIRTTEPRARVQAGSVLDTVVLTGTVPTAEAAQHIMDIAGIYSKQLVNHMRVAGVQQVLLRCTVAEVNRSATRQLGFNGWMAGDNFKDMFTVSQLDGINPVNIGGAASTAVNGRIPFVTDTNGLPLTPQPTLSLGFPRLQMQVFIQALRENGLLHHVLVFYKVRITPHLPYARPSSRFFTIAYTLPRRAAFSPPNPETVISAASAPRSIRSLTRPLTHPTHARPLPPPPIPQTAPTTRHDHAPRHTPSNTPHPQPHRSAPMRVATSRGESP